MRRQCTILVACILAAGLTACGDAGALVAPEAPRYDGGTLTGGSGGRVLADTATVAPHSPETTTEETTAERGGGYTAGSGG